ncbi:flavin reductase [Micromonospora ureilytica]|uniref:flavin reductase n=1 Tax=Micromonospora ureilytica TaxID=709868 RepID=UPI0040390EF4
MRRRRGPHLPTRPTWRCQACGIAWPCSTAKLRLLAEYRDDRAALLDRLTALRDRAAIQLDGAPTANLDDRFVTWAHPR